MKILNKIQKELKAPKNQKNTFGGYNYRSCEDILEAVKPLLGEATLTIADEIVAIGNGNSVITTQITDKSGATKTMSEPDMRYYVKATATLAYNGESVSVSAFAREPLNKKGMDESQITGAASSYARKYALNGLFCIDDTKDADATNEHGTHNAKPTAQPKQTFSDWFKQQKFPVSEQTCIEWAKESATKKGNKFDYDSLDKVPTNVRNAIIAKMNDIVDWDVMRKENSNAA